MPQQTVPSTQNNFTGGLKTEYTGLNFPVNAATDCDNVVFDIVGDVTRREGFDYENNYQLQTVNRTGLAISSYIWTNVGGDGNTKYLVKQIGNTLYFYNISGTTTANSLSSQQVASTIDISAFLVASSTKVPSGIECEYSDGNGYLFVYHPYCEPFFVSIVDGVLTGLPITIQTRDFTGFNENLAYNTRPSTLNAEHSYNLQNQGWTTGNTWEALSSSNSYGGGVGPTLALGNITYIVQSGLTGITNGQTIKGTYNNYIDARFSASFLGVVVSYSGTSLVINVNNISYGGGNPVPWVTVLHGSQFYQQTLHITPANTGYITQFFTSQTVYPSNSDVWWRFKDSTDVFNPSVTVANTTLNVGQAPQGHFILKEFFQDRANLGGVSVGNTSTLMRPRTGAWFAGRVWYTGVDASQPTSASSDAAFYNWSENIYFSQIVEGVSNFGNCYQTNDPTAEDLFDLLPDDGGVISIQGCGKIYKLFPIQNGMLVFCANGIWFITGSQGIGFTANDYTVTKISSIQSISSTSFVNVMGLPYFWNEEGIYTVSPAQQGLGLTVEPLTVSTILSFYNNIPTASKQFVRGAYDPINYIVTWVYKDTLETNVTTRYEFNRCLNFNTYTKAFYPYTLQGTPKVNGIQYVSYPNPVTAPEPSFKYIVSVPSGATYNFTFAEEKDEDYVDFESTGTGTNYVSYFITGYQLTGKGLSRFQPGYIYIYSRNDVNTAYKIQSIFDFASSPNSGRWSSSQLIINNKPNYGMVMRRHVLRGHGYAFQMKITSDDGEPFDIMGWAINENVNTGV